MNEIISTTIYSCLGIFLMLFGTFIIDLIIPCDFQVEIKKRNVAVGYITAGSSIAVGIILKHAIMSPGVYSAEQSLIGGIGSTFLYFTIGIIFCIIGYKIIQLFNTKYNINKEIEDGNPAVGLMVMGFFIGLSLVISGAIY